MITRYDITNWHGKWHIQLLVYNQYTDHYIIALSMGWSGLNVFNKCMCPAFTTDIYLSSWSDLQKQRDQEWNL